MKTIQNADFYFEQGIQNNEKKKQQIFNELRNTIDYATQGGKLLFEYRHKYTDFSPEFWQMLVRYLERKGFVVNFYVSPALNKDMAVFNISF